MRLAIFTHVIHQKHSGRYFAYSPYVREMNIWLKYVEVVELVAPLSPKNEKHVHESPYEDFSLRFTKIPSFDLLNFMSLVKALFKIPYIIFKMVGAMRGADHLHLRCPGNIGSLACLCQMFFPGKQKTAKYAGNWDPKAKQPWTYKLQRWILSNTLLTRNMTVLVYGQWPDQSKNILPFFTASFSENEIEKIKKDLSPPYKFLFVGNLVPGKQPQWAVKLVIALNERNIPAEIHVYGDGVLKYELEIQAEIKDYIHLHGNQPLDVIKQAYKESHFLILASKSEGWPKAVAEAMFFGCIPVVTEVSCVPWMLGGGSRGILISEKEYRIENREKRTKVESGERRVDSQGEFGRVERRVERTGFPETPAYRQGRLEVTSGTNNDWKDALEETVQKIIELIQNPEEMRRMSMEAQEWSQEYTLEKFEQAIREILFKTQD